MNGRTLAHYEILDKLDEGGMGVVYRARDTRLGRTLALKVLRPEAVGDPERRLRFVQEARAASALNHAGIVTIYDVDQAATPEGTIDFIAMEYVEGQPLSRLIGQGAVPITLAVEYGAQIAEALGAAHQAGIVHRDVKPGNVLVTPAGRVKVVDFGLAKLRDPASIVMPPDDASPTMTARPATREGMIVGTVAYMSPEQAEGKPVDARSDVFSLGTVLYEMLGGRRPFRGDSVLSTLSAVLHESPPSLRSVRPKVPAELERLVARCLRKDPGERYPSGIEVHHDLLTVQDRLGSPRPTLRALLRRPRYAATLLVLVAVLVAAGAWWWRRSSNVRWARSVGLPEVARLAREGKAVEAWRVAQQVRRDLPGDPALDRLWSDFSLRYTVRSEPPGAAVYFKEYLAPAAPWEFAGRTPIETRLPVVYLRFKAEKEGYDTVEAATTQELGTDGAKVQFALSPKGSAPAGFVRIPAGRSEFPGALAVDLPEFWIDRYEVTNRQFKEFVDQGGYERPEYWKEAFLRDGRSLSFAQAMAGMHDQTGRPGPATWELGAYPDGQADFPVGGVSWYEASAYATFAGKSLPTVHHWRSAARIGIFSEVVMLSNFAGKGPAAVGGYQGLGPYGTYDMAGNVKEWCANSSGPGRYILGGAWNEPPYIYASTEAEPPFTRLPTYGFRCVRLEGPVPAAATGEVKIERRDYSHEKPVRDEVFEVFRGLYSYDRGDLKVETEGPQDEQHWRSQKVSFAAGYGGERVPAKLYLPIDTAPPYQTVIFFPGSDAEQLRAGQDFALHRFDFLVRSGRAVLFPTYKGTYERIVPGPWSPNKRRDLVIDWSKDLGRAIDYLETRPDLDHDRVAFYGFSLGGTYGPVLTALEPRIKTLVLVGAGLAGVKLPPEVDPINFAPRVRVPVLMLNGREDFDTPLQTQQLPLLRLLGASEKNQVLFDGGHMPPTMHPIIAETLAWLDRQLGPVRPARQPTKR